jgi:hypothetical protein
MREIYRKHAQVRFARDQGGHMQGANDFAGTTSTAIETWLAPDPGILGDEMPSAPRLPLSCFGAAVDYIQRAAVGANAPPDYVAAMLLAAVSGLVGKALAVRINESWYEPLILWLAIIGPPSSGKTPAAKFVRKRLYKIQKQMMDDYEASIDVMIEEVKENGPAAGDKQAVAEMKEEVERLSELRAHSPRCIVGDATVEALADVE